jgi:hypothetical protein
MFYNYHTLDQLAREIDDQRKREATNFRKLRQFRKSRKQAAK